MRDTVSFSQDSFHATIYLPSLLDLPVKNVHKIFTIMLWDDRENEQAIRDTELFLEDIVPESKQAWIAASVRYQQEWRLIEKRARSGAPRVRHGRSKARSRRKRPSCGV